MKRVQYVSQKSVPEADVYRLSDREQDEFIKEVAQSMVREFRDRTKDAQALGDVGFWVTGPHHDPLQGTIHVHNLAVWVDLDTMAADAQFRLDYLEAESAGGVVT